MKEVTNTTKYFIEGSNSSSQFKTKTYENISLNSMLKETRRRCEKLLSGYNAFIGSTVLVNAETNKVIAGYSFEDNQDYLNSYLNRKVKKMSKDEIEILNNTIYNNN